MAINFPAQIGIESFGYRIGFSAHIYGNVMLEAHFADVPHERLEIGNSHHAVTAEGIEFVICELALAGIDADDAAGIVGSDSAEGRFIRGYSADNRAVSIFLADRAGDYFLIIHPRVFEK